MSAGDTLSLGLDEVIAQHLFEAGHLATVRTVLVGAPHADLFALRRHDERIAAHLDGLFVAADAARGLIDEALASPEPGHVFAAAVVAIRERDGPRLEQLYQLADGNAQMRDALIDAMGWVEPSALRGIVSQQLASTQPRRCEMAILASARHHVDPGLLSQRRLEASDAAVRSAACRAGAVLGYRELVSELARNLRHETDPVCRLWMGWAAVLLGDREEALQALKLSAFEQGALRWEAFALVCLVDTLVAARDWLRTMPRNSGHAPWLIRAAGRMGDPAHAQWLINQMADEKLARCAGEAFSLITGLDLTRAPFEQERSPDVDSGPNEDPDDDNVDLDEDEGLPWPDPAQVQAWWDEHGARFTTGVRHFMGAPPSRAHCLEVLKNGFQRQRIAAAYHLCLLDPGTPLFEWRAPAWRQQRVLAQMS